MTPSSHLKLFDINIEAQGKSPFVPRGAKLFFISAKILGFALLNS